MTIQIPNPGTGNGQTGDNEYVLWSKVRDNFSDQSNAASRLVGTDAGQVPLAEQAYAAAQLLGFMQNYSGNVDDLPIGSKALTTQPHINTPNDTAISWMIYTMAGHSSTTYTSIRRQIAMGYANVGDDSVYTRSRRQSGGWTAWRLVGQSSATYNTTTAAGANTVVDSSGRLMRSTSSERYKDILADLVLTDDAYANAMSLAPIVYRSTADADNPNYHFYSFSAEALGAFDPAFVLWRHTETVTDADGNMIERPLAEPQAEGLNINALLAFNHAIAIKQDAMIKALTQRVNDLAQKLEV